MAESVSEADLQADPPIQTPVSYYSLRGFLTFICHHEAYPIRQLSLPEEFLVMSR